MHEKRHIVVTGGAGFVGSNVVAILASNESNRITVLDDYSTGRSTHEFPNVTYLKSRTKDIAICVTDSVDIIYHLGEYARVSSSLSEPNLVWDANIVGSLAILEFWRTQKCRLVYAGSSTRFSMPFFGTDRPENLAPYTWAKAAIADLIKCYGSWYGLKYSIAYFYNVYGPGEPDSDSGTLIGILRKRFREGLPLEISSPGTQTRAFTHVEDAAAAMVLAGTENASGEYQIAGEDIYSLIDVAKLFGGNIVMRAPPKSARSHITADTSRIRALGWRPSRRLKEYVQSFVTSLGRPSNC